YRELAQAPNHRARDPSRTDLLATNRKAHRPTDIRNGRRAWHKSGDPGLGPGQYLMLRFDHGQCNDGDVRGCRYYARDGIEAAGQRRIKQYGIRMNGWYEFKRLILVLGYPRDRKLRLLV